MVKSNLLCAVFAVVFLATAGADTIDLFTLWNGQTFDSENTTLSANNTYTLSSDFTVTKTDGVTRQTVRLPAGNVTFDFSDGNHKLGTGTLRLLGGNNKGPYSLNFTGGIWDLGGVGSFQLGGWANLCYDDVTYTFDGTIVTNLSISATFLNGFGTNMHYIVKGGSRFYGTSNYIDICPATKAESDSGRGLLSRLIEFKEGSKFFSGTAAVFDNRNNNVDRLQNCTIRFAGEGTVATGTEANGAGNCDFYVGYRAPGYRLEVLDGAKFDFRYLHVGGYYNANNGNIIGDYGYSNSVYVANGGEIKTMYTLDIGNGPGAGHNSFVIDGGKLTTSDIEVGPRSSFNSFAVTNGTVTANKLKIGYGARANSNLVCFSGAETKLSFTATTHTLFSQGTGNTLVFDNGFNFGTPTTDWQYSLYSQSGGSEASTGNVVRVEGGACITGRNFRVTSSNLSTNNVLHVGGGAVLDLVSLSLLYGGANSLCISNGTVRFTDGYGFHCAGTGNVCRLSGEAPKVRFVGSESSTGVATFRSGVELQYDLTELSAAYAEPAILVKWFQMHANTHLTFRGVEEVSERLSAPAEFVLARATDADHLISSDNAIATVVAEANENLPDRAKILFANDGHDLVLRIRPPAKGLLITIL